MVLIDDAYSLTPEDQPERLAEVIAKRSPKPRRTHRDF
jgi:hypothetical protein